MTDSPLLTVLSFSGGQQSSALLWMILRGDLPFPEAGIVLTADPGMENSDTYRYVKLMQRRCDEVEIEAKTVVGPNLLNDIMTLKQCQAKRLDTPPYWVVNDEGKQARLLQGCTKHYKIAPMDREIRRQLRWRYDISEKSKRLPAECVEKWIGFGADEVHRVKKPPQKYVRFRYPLIELGMTKDDVLQYFTNNHFPIPPRSVCNACFANGLATFKEMHDNRPADWEQAVAVDESIRDWSQIGVKGAVYVSSTMLPLKKLAAMNFELDGDEDEDEYSCDSGYCFT